MVGWKPDYVTAVELKNYLKITNTESEAFLGMWVTAASRNVDDFCGRQFGQVAAPEARKYKAVYDRHEAEWLMDIDDLPTTVGFSMVDAAGAAVTGYELLPWNNALKGLPYTQMSVPSCGPFTPTGSWGWSAVPASVRTGLFLQAARLAARRNSPFGISGSPAAQGEIRLLAQLDPDFKTSLKPFQRKWWAR